ncbi:MAG: APC family permease [Gemmatimonadaceae bacterium]
MKTEEGLIRAVGVRGLTAGIVNYTIGAGIFVLPAIVAGKVGNAAPVIYVICAIAMGLIVLCFAEAGSRISLSGGTYAYAGLAFGPYAGFMVAMCLWFGSAVLASAAVANVFVDALAQLSPVFANSAVRAAIIIATYSALLVINIRGVKIGSTVVQTVTAGKLLPLIVLVVFGAFAVNKANLAWTGLPPTSDIARTTVMLIFAFLGVESALTPSGEVRDPARTVPRSIFLALAITTILYIAIQVVSQGVLGPELATSTKAPLAETARKAFGDGGRFLILVGAAISTFGYVAGDMLAAPRGIYALGKDGLLPTWIGRVHEKYATPYIAITFHAVLCAIFALTGSFASLVVLAVLATLVVYLICCLATIELRRKNIRTEASVPFRVPGGAAVPILASAIIIWLMTSSTLQEVRAMAIFLAVLTVIFLAMRMRRTPAPTL